MPQTLKIHSTKLEVNAAHSEKGSTLFSVILPVTTEDSLETFELCVKSILSQTCKDFILFIILTGKNREQHLKLIDTTIENEVACHVYCSEHKLSAAEARNSLVSIESQAKYLAFIDSDDQWLPHHLANFKLGYSGLDSIFYMCDFYKGKANNSSSLVVVHFKKSPASLIDLIRQPVLLSSVITDVRNVSFEEIKAEDFVYCDKLIKTAGTIIHCKTPSVIYDTTNTSKKPLIYKMRRTYGVLHKITGNHFQSGVLWIIYCLFRQIRA